MEMIKVFGRSLFTAALMSAVAIAAPVTFNGTNGGGLSAQAIFDVTGNQLSVLLVNTSTADVMVPSQVLTGLFWNMTDSSGDAVSLTPVSASVNAGSSLIGCLFFCGSDISRHWGYTEASNPTGTGHGVGASGLGGVFGAHDPFNGTGSLQGIDWGIVSAGDNPWTGNGGIWTGLPLVKNAVLFNFTFSGDASNFKFDDVRFQYGSKLNEPSLCGDPVSTPTATPEPASYALIGAGLLVLGAIRRKRS